MREQHIGLGCMRVPEGDGGVVVLRAALDAGVTLFDTAASYGPEKKPHHNERQLAEALGDRSESVTIVTKAGMKRGRGRWMPNGKRKTILADATASAEALGRPPDVLLLHLPDPSTPIETSVRALVAAREAGLCGSVGLSNVTLGQLQAALTLTEIAMVELAVGPFDEEAVRGGVVERCRALGVPVLAHSPLGGPKKPRRLTDDADLQWLAESHGAWHKYTSPGSYRATAWVVDANGLRDEASCTWKWVAPPPPVAVQPVLPNSACDPNYTGCVPIASDVDCAGGSGNGPAYTGTVQVIGRDIYDLDRDGDGWACE